MTTNHNNFKDLTVDHILSSIRKIIKTEDFDTEDDILVLTEIVEKSLSPSSSEGGLTKAPESSMNLLAKKSTNMAVRKSEIKEQGQINTKHAGNIEQDQINLVNDFAKTIEEASKAPPKFKNNGLEDFLTDIIRPYVKIWLDEHLPVITKKIVEHEIEKILSKNKE